MPVLVAYLGHDTVESFVEATQFESVGITNEPSTIVIYQQH